MQWITGVIVPHKLASDRLLFTRLVRSASPPHPQQNTYWKHPGEKTAKIQYELSHTRRCNIFTNMYNDKYKKSFSD